MSQRKIRWGILGTGTIATLFTSDLRELEGVEVAAVGSRTQAKADVFSQRFGASRCYGSYEALVADQEVDVVYVATPHSLHREHAILALEANKAVLCEKPFAINAQQAEEMVRCARGSGQFLMEAMWTRFFPLMERLRELVSEGAIGEPRILTADFGFREDFDAESILFNPAYGGGSLLDVGVYGVSLASMLFGAAVDVQGTAQMGSSGVDETAAVVLRFPAGQLALLHSALRVETPQEAVVSGSAGSIRVKAPWWKPTEMVIARDGEPPEMLEFPLDGGGYGYEAQEVMRCLHASELESDRLPLDESLQVMRILDEARARWGLKYPME